jgi:hypothetical protein
LKLIILKLIIERLDRQLRIAKNQQRFLVLEAIESLFGTDKERFKPL